MPEELLQEKNLDDLVRSTLKSMGFTLEVISHSETSEKNFRREFEESKKCFYLEIPNTRVYFIRGYTVAIFPYLITNYAPQNLLATDTEELGGRVIYYSFLPQENQEGDGILSDSNVGSKTLGPKEAVNNMFSIIYHDTLNQPYQRIPKN